VQRRQLTLREALPTRAKDYDTGRQPSRRLASVRGAITNDRHHESACANRPGPTLTAQEYAESLSWKKARKILPAVT